MTRIGFQSSPTKDAVRTLWCTPLLTALRDAVERQYFYLGLPGPEARDLTEWQHLIGRICAFQMLDADAENEMESLTRLEQRLADQFTVRGIPCDTFLGFLEEVMVHGKDAQGKVFVQTSLVTLYQLDFCHALTDWTSPEVGLNLRYQAIRSLLQHQSGQPPEEKARPFVIFLTVRDEIDTQSAVEFAGELVGSPEGVLVQQMIDEIPFDDATRKQIRHPILKAYAFRTLSGYFRGVHVRTLFLPPVYYVGNRPQDHMILFCVLGAFDRLSARAPRTLQTFHEFLRLQGLSLDGNALNPMQRCRVETERVWGADRLLAQYIERFLADPVWTEIPREADAVRTRN